jgi:hypothetical protein
MNSKINLKEIKKNFCFHHVKINENGDSEDIYFCKCGKKITQDKNIAKKDEITLENNVNDKNYYDNLDVLSRFDEGISVVCPKCKIDYFKAQNSQIVKSSNTDFYAYFDFKIEGNRIYLYKNKLKSNCTDKSKYVNLKETISYLCIDKETKKLFFKNYDVKKEVEFSLDNLLRVVQYFYENNDLSVIDNLIDVHRFLSELASVVVDSKNMDIVEGLMSQMIGKPGIDILMKVNTIFFGIIIYSNLSTIALTKGTVFLYDMLSNCKLPNISTLTENNVTSPLKIFNFLVELENKSIQEEIDLEKGENSKFVYTSKNGDGKKMELNFDLERFGFKNENLVDISEGSINVREDIKNKSVSKYIFNKIEKFNDYKSLIKFTKFISYEELINLVIKYDIDYIIKLYNKIEFRSDINSETLKQFIPLTLDYLKNNSLTINNSKSFVSQMLGRDELEEKEVLISGEGVKLNYSLLTSYSFTIYDDCSRILEELNWDKNKEFNKIKKQSELIEYHDKLVEHYNMLSDKQKYEKFKKFAEKFSFLEEYEGDLKIKLLSTPAMVLKAADEMKNCAGSYVTRISQGKYLILMLEDKSDKRVELDSKFMLGLNLSSTTGLEFEQLKSVCNRKASDRQKTMVMKYLEEKDISYKEINDLRLGEMEMRL